MKYIIQNKPMKIIVFILITFVFTVLYSLFDDSNFTGLNKVSEVIKEEIIKEEVKEEVKDEVDEDQEILKPRKTKVNFEGFQMYDNSYKINRELEKDKAIEEKAKEVDTEVEKEELTKEKIKPTLYNKIFNRLYFSICTGGLLGYGDVYPITNYVKILTMMQTFSTICLIVF